MPRDLRPTLAVSLVFASTAGLLACPQLLSDDFGSLPNTDGDSCARAQTCTAGEGGAGGSSGGGGSTSGSGGTTSAAGGSTSNGGGSGAPAAGSGGSGEAGSGEAGSGSAGSGGTGDTGGTGGSDPSDASVDPPEPPACWFVELEDDTHDTSSNCLGIHGWNQVVTEPTSAVSLSYEDGAACFTGTVANDGWAVYNFTINYNSSADRADPWGAQAEGIGGFQFDATGTSLPPQIRVIYDDVDDGEFCRVITPGPGVQVPFASAHPGCSTSSSNIPDGTDLTFIRFAMDPAASDYAIDFCLTIRAIP